MSDGAKRFECEEAGCNYAGPSTAARRQHQYRCHSATAKELRTCRACHAFTGTVIQVRRHENRCTEGESIVCDICPPLARRGRGRADGGAAAAVAAAAAAGAVAGAGAHRTFASQRQYRQHCATTTHKEAHARAQALELARAARPSALQLSVPPGRVVPAERLLAPPLPQSHHAGGARGGARDDDAPAAPQPAPPPRLKRKRNDLGRQSDAPASAAADAADHSDQQSDVSDLFAVADALDRAAHYVSALCEDSGMFESALWADEVPTALRHGQLAQRHLQSLSSTLRCGVFEAHANRQRSTTIASSRRLPDEDDERRHQADDNSNSDANDSFQDLLEYEPLGASNATAADPDPTPPALPVATTSALSALDAVALSDSE